MSLERRLQQERVQRRLAEQQASQKGLHRKTLSRRALIFGVGIGAAGAIGIGIYLRPQDEENPLIGVIQQEISESGILPSEAEKKLWSKSYTLEKPPSTFSVIPSEVEKARGRVHSTLHKMPQSENPHFKEAGKELAAALDSRKLSINMIVGGKSPVGIQDILAGGKHFWQLNVDILEPLFHSDAVDLAGILTHEHTHLQRFSQFVQGAGSPREAFERTQLLSSDKAIVLREEAYAYERQAQAILHQYALVGVNPKARDSIELAYSYIQGGKSGDDERFRMYIKNRVVGLRN